MLCEGVIARMSSGTNTSKVEKNDECDDGRESDERIEVINDVNQA